MLIVTPDGGHGVKRGENDRLSPTTTAPRRQGGVVGFLVETGPLHEKEPLGIGRIQCGPACAIP